MSLSTVLQRIIGITILAAGTILAQVPTITSFSPLSGAIGSSVTITGTNFSTTPANNTVYLGGGKAAVTAASATSLTVTVPLGATNGLISVTTGGLTARSRIPFAPSFTSDNSLTTSSFPTGTSITFPKISNSISRGNGLAADFDGDGKPDLVHVAYADDIISVHRNVHTGGALASTSFGSRQDFTAGDYPYDLDFGDVDGDGKLDVVVVNLSSNTISIFRNTSTVGSISFAAKTDYSTLSSPQGISLGDVDGDGKLDIGVVTSYKYSLFRNTSSSGTVSFAARVDYTTSDNPKDIKLVDLDGNGLCDIALMCGGSTMPDQVMAVFRSTSTSGTFSFAAEQQTLLDYYMTELEFADFDGDGKPEIYAAKYDYNVYVIPNTSTSGTISFGTTITLAGYYTPTLAVADVTGDGKPEAIVASGSTSAYIRIFKNTSTSGTVSFATGVEYVYQEGGSYYPMASIVPADFNLDGKTDLLALASSSSYGIGLFENKMTSPQFRASSYNYSMGTFPVGKYVKDSINVTNNGGQSLTISSVSSTNASEFSVSPASATIATGSNQWFVVNYLYNGAGTRTSKLIFSHTAANLTDTVSLSATSSFSAAANAGQMVQLDGVNDYINIPDATHPTAYTLEAWVKFNTVSAQNIIVRTDASGPSTTFSHQLILNAAGKFAHYTFFGTSNTVVGTTTVVAGQWYHVAITAQNSGTMKLFVNGREEGTAQSVSGTLWASGTRWMVGMAGNSYEGSAGYFNGSIDELRLWNTARTASQIQSSYASLAGNESNLSRYFRLDEGTGTSSGDGTGNGITASLVNGAAWGSSNAPLGTPVYSTSSSSVAFGYVANGATKTDSVTISNTSNGVLNITPSSNNVKLTFSPASLSIVSGQSAKLYLTFAPQSGSDSTGTITLTHNAAGSPNIITANHLTTASFSKGTTAGNMLLFNYDQYSDFASTPYSSTLNPSGSLTYEAWARNDVPDYSYSGYVVSSGDYYTGVKIYPDYYGWAVQIGTGGSPVYLTASGKTQSVWYHLAVTLSGSTARFYVNGVLRDTKTVSYNRNTSYPFYIGTNTSSPWYSGFTGAIDEVRVWNTERTQEQVAADMTNSLYGNESGLAGYWRLDNGSGTTATDLTLLGNNLTLGGTNYTPTWQSSTAGFPAGYFKTYTASLSYGNVQTGKTKADSFYVRNFGGASLSISSVTSDNARYSIAPTSATIASNDSAKFVVTFAPTAVQAENATITLTHTAYGSPNTVTVSGTGATATYSSNTALLAFGTLQVGVSKLDSVTISNTGTISLVIDSVRSSNSNYTISPTSATIAAGGSQKFYVTFAAATPTGAANGTVSFYHSTAGSPGTVSVTGTKVQQAAANAGTALTFDGSNDYISRAVFSTATNNIAFDAWVKWDGQTASGNRIIIYNGSTGTNGYGLIIEGSSTPNNALSILNGGVALARSTYVLTSNQWQHVAVVRESGTWKLYVDGVQQTLTNATTAPTTPSGSLYIGSNTGGSEAFKGSIDEVRFWSTARTQAQIQAGYNSLAGTESGLSAYYRFDENTGTTAYDNSGNGRNGTLTNGPVFASSAALIGTPVYSVSPSSKAFGSVQVGTANTDSVTISNTGGGLLNIGTITSGNAAYTVTPSNVAIRSGSSQKFYITFLAPAPAAAQNTSLSVPHNASGSPNSIALTGASIFQAASTAGNGLTFTGTSKFVDIASNAGLTSSAFTVELWLKIGSTWTWSCVIDKGRNTGNNWFILTTNSGSGQSQGVLFGMQGGTELVNIWGDNGWHHIAATFDGSTQRLYVDGVLTGGYAGVTYSPTNDLIRIGGRQDTSVYSLNPFNGNIDEVRLWNVARTQSEIQQSYTSRAGNETGLVSYLRFDESSGTTAYDATGNGRNGTLVNGLARMTPSTATVGSPVYSSSASSKNIGTIYLSNSRQDSVTISNTGSGVLNVTAISSNNAQFTVSPSTLNIVSGGSAKLYITALPTALGLQSGSVTLTHNAAGSPSAIAVSATAVVPVISSFTPSSGPVGTSVVISGSGFSSTPANNTVTFGATKGTVTASTDTTITVTVPSGATYAPITVTTNNLQAHSRNGFIVTFTTSNVIAASSFASSQSITAPSSTYGMTFSDIDGDGKPDAVIGVQSSNGVSVLRNTGSSGTVSFASALNFATGSNGLDVSIGDLDGDGKPDVVATKQTAGFSIFRNTSTSGSVSFATRIDSAISSTHGSAIGDLDGDGKPELVVVNNSASSVRIYKNSSTPGTIVLSSVLSVTTGGSPREVHLIDFDGDGKLDIATNNFSGGSVSVLHNTSTVGSFSFAAKLDLTGASSTFGIALGDLTGDGKPEVVSGSSGNLIVYQNTSSSGAVSFAAGVGFTANANRTVTIGDFSGDGKPDIASINSTGTVSVLKNTYTSGSITGSSFSKTDFTNGSTPWNLRSADLDGDGKVDLAAINQTGSSMAVLRNTVPLPPTFVPNPSAIAFGSVNLGSNKTDSTWVKNTGGVALSVTAVASTNAQYTVSPSTATVAIGDSQKFTVTFTPTQASAVNAKLVFTSNTAAASDTVSVSGTGVGPVLTLSASSKSFGSVLVSANKKDSIYLKNTGNASLSVTNVVSDNAEFTVNSTTFTVNALDSAKLIITFAPASSGSKSATVQITHNGQTSPTSVSVDGRGIQPIFSASAANIAFGNVGYYQTKMDSITVSNPGVDTLVIASVTKSNAVYTVTPTSATIAPSGSQKFYVTYAPVAVSTTHDTLSFTHNAGSVTKIPLSGTGALLPASAAGSALDLNGSNQYADLADGVWFNGNFTVETWVYIRAVANYTRIIDFANGQSSNNIIITASEGTSGKIGMHIFSGASSTTIVTPNAIALNTWVHVACVFNSGTGRIYLNGVEVVSGSLNTPQNITRTLNYIGRSQWADAYANMRMDEFRIWNVARTATQIQSSMNSSLAGNESGLLAYLRFDESSGTTAVNFTAGGSNAAMLGGASRAVSTVPVPGPNFIASKSAFVHGVAVIGGSAPDTMWVKNLGGASLVIDSARSSNSEFTILPASATVVSGDSVRFIAALSPLTAGSKNANMTFYSNAFSTPNVVGASGTAYSAEPTVRDSNAVAATLLPYSVTLKWKKGDGENHLVLIKASSAVDGTPSDGTEYTPNGNYGSGTQLGTGNYTLYTGTADSVVVTNLAAGTTYHVSVIGYNGTGISANYLLPSAATASFTVPYAVNSPMAGNALVFDGTGTQSMTVLSSTPTAYTVEMWVKVNSTGNQSIFSRTDAGGPMFSYSHAVDIYGGYLRHYLYDGASKSVTDGTPVAANTWYHIAVTASNGGSMRLYVNGTEVGTPLSVSTLWTDGDRYVVGYGGNGPFDGSIDELRIWNAERTVQEIRENMHRRIGGSQPGLQTYYQFNEANGNAADSIHGVVGTLVNAPARQQSTIAFGNGTSTTVTTVQSGVHTLGAVSLNLTEGFDNNADVTSTLLSAAPNVLPSGYVTLVGSTYLVLTAYGSLGSYSADLTIDFGSSVIDPRADTYPGGIKLFTRSKGSDGAWTLVGGATSANSSTGAVTWSGITSLGQFAAVYDETALPVEIVSFSAVSRRLNAELAWKTATELNNYGFDIERKTEGGTADQWTRVAFLEGAGTTNAPREYSYTDRNLTAGKYSYRLKQIDRDGKFGYSMVTDVVVGAAPLAFELAQNYPNPFNPSTNIEFTVPVTGRATLKVYNIMGQEVSTLFDGMAEAGMFHQYVFDASRLSSGVYFARLVSGKNIHMIRMMLLK